MDYRLYYFRSPTLFSAHFQPGMNDTANWAKSAEQAVEQDAKRLAETVFDCVFVKNQKERGRISLSVSQLDHFVELYIDRWIETAELHAGLYAKTGQQAQPTIQSTAYVPPGMPGTLSDLKGLSGDISGAIGEGLFVATMREWFKLRQGDFGHIKPTSRKRFPDFAILQPSASLLKVLQSKYGSSTISKGRPGFIPAEVKTVSTVNTAADIKPKILDATVQVLSFWLSVQGATAVGPSILFVAMRNTNKGSYDLALIHGQ